MTIVLLLRLHFLTYIRDQHNTLTWCPTSVHLEYTNIFRNPVIFLNVVRFLLDFSVKAPDAHNDQHEDFHWRFQSLWHIFENLLDDLFHKLPNLSDHIGV